MKKNRVLIKNLFIEYGAFDIEHSANVSVKKKFDENGGETPNAKLTMFNAELTMATKKQSAGILLYRLTNGHPEFFLVHPGGPFWAKKDAGVWSIPKGEFDEGEDRLQAAIREFKEETGQEIDGNFFPLAPIQQKAGKTIYAFAVEGNVDEKNIRSNTFSMEWPPKSGKQQQFPEVDRAEWFSAKEAKVKINERQAALIEEVEQLLKK